jgi:hypothetical protein
MMMNWRGFGRKRSWPNFKALSRNSPGGTEKKARKTSIRIAGHRGRDLNLGSPEYEAGVLTARHEVLQFGLNRNRFRFP